jgi:nucleoside phosphorylase
MPEPKKMRHEDYTIAWICALPRELAAAQYMLDEQHEQLEGVASDENTYTFGRIGKHHVVMAVLPAGTYGKVNTAVRVNQMKATFSGIRFGLMVGVGGGVPDEDHDVRLGDIVVSQPGNNFGGVIQYDLGKTGEGGRISRNNQLNQPPDVVLTALASLQAKHLRKKKLEDLMGHHKKMLEDDNMDGSQYQGTENDILFNAEYLHIKRQPTCAKCDKAQTIERDPRRSNVPAIHYGNIASGDQVMKDGITRDRISDELGGVLCFEMEAAGLMNSFQSLSIRGISDYCDSHKNKRWQEYAAAIAAAYAKDLLSEVPPNKVVNEPTLSQPGATAPSQASNTSPSAPQQNHSSSRVWSGNVNSGGGPLIQGDQTSGGDMNFSWNNK